jgi:hypothetical protein
VEFAELADGPTGCGKVVNGGCIFASKFIVTRSQVLTEADRRTRPNMMLSLR